MQIIHCASTDTHSREREREKEIERERVCADNPLRQHGYTLTCVSQKGSVLCVDSVLCRDTDAE